MPTTDRTCASKADTCLESYQRTRSISRKHSLLFIITGQNETAQLIYCTVHRLKTLFLKSKYEKFELQVPKTIVTDNCSSGLKRSDDFCNYLCFSLSASPVASTMSSFGFSLPQLT
ncbi:hypothetical protein T12_3048 [Trichinella patagoniensis]|uniref:Uncharacterized protein n=1 Tax=Trichinella patagoniensis TaxID=990121 RepID=A0A0V0ZIH4_9BILA|nr:hypothetical protein T12_3048 [Trichinella patagoniensis]